MKRAAYKTWLFFFIIILVNAAFPESIGNCFTAVTCVCQNSLDFLVTALIPFFPWVTSEKLLIVIALVSIVLAVVSYKLTRKLIYRRSHQVPGVVIEDAPLDQADEHEDVSDDIDYSRGSDYNREVIVKFFLKVFKLQLGELKSAPGSYKYIDSINVWPNRVYELSVMHNEEWVSRRLTIGPLGDDGVSKSVCYYVIYDDHLVVKVPSEPIDDFDEYLDYIKADMKIAKRLYPKECIIPKVSVIMGRLITDADFSGTYSEKVEKNYIDRLHANTQMQDYLKIGESFVFFMDLSRFYFLSNVVKEMHDMDNLMPTEILNHPEIIWDTYSFEGRYGKDSAFIGFEMRNIYDEYEREINRLLMQYGAASSLPTYNMKTWFLIHLSGKGKIEPDGNFSEGFAEDLNALSRESMIDNRVSIESYRSVVRDYISKRTIAKHKPEMGSIVTNLISLLIWLGKRKIALRDLKPDNLLIAGDPEQYPQFLRQVDQYSIGFIDLETAVDYSPDNIDDIIQPQLGGTPKYATPSHLFPNELITGIFGDLKRILHLQDWHACIAMIFRIVTGSTLFEKTATLLPEIKRILESPVNDSDHLISMTEYVSRLFWKSAYDEFHEKLDKRRNILNIVTIIVLEKDKAVLIKEMADERKIIFKVILKRINSQTFFKSRANKEKIYNAKIEQIASMREKCEKGIAHSVDRAAVLKFFIEMEFLKKQAEQRNTALNYLRASSTEIPVSTIMELMFNVVFTAMYTDVWGVITEEIEAEIECNSDASYDATI